MKKEDIVADVEMYFRQIICMSDLMIECHNEIAPNLLIIRDIAQSGFNKLISMDEV